MKTLFLWLFPVWMTAQTLIPIPDTLSGSEIDLYLRDTAHVFFPGFITSTKAYNGSYLGKTIILQQGQQVTLRVHNELNDTTTTHWHGLHVSAENDGGPHTMIMAGETWAPSFTVMDDAATYWYHPHLHEKTMTHVLEGAAGLIIVRDNEEAALTLPRTYGVDDIPLICQFQTFNNTNRQIVLDDELDNAILVNGTINGRVQVPAQVVRLRLLNASSHRVFRFGLTGDRTFYQIATDGGLLSAPVSLTRLTLASGERAEVLVDLTGMEGQTIFLRTFGNELAAGFPGGPSMMGMPLGPLDNITSNVLEIQAVAPTSGAITTIPTSLVPVTMWPQAGATNRNIRFTAQPMNSMTNFFINNAKFDHEVINFTTELNRTEIWTLTNQTMMAHPFHVHGNSFYVLSVNGAPPPANWLGKKDVVMVPPMGGNVSILTKFEDFADPHMPYMYHCHILSHEDHGMMGQFIINPLSSSSGEAVMEQRVRVYPNPVDAARQFTIETEGSIWSVAVSDMFGRVITPVRVYSDRVYQFDAATPAGTYLVTIRTGIGVVHRKVVFQGL
jgi:blue copper oxidase